MLRPAVLCFALLAIARLLPQHGYSCNATTQLQFLTVAHMEPQASDLMPNATAVFPCIAASNADVNRPCHGKMNELVFYPMISGWDRPTSDQGLLLLAENHEVQHCTHTRARVHMHTRTACVHI